MTDKRVSSPASTGGAGSSFEQHVGAYWLAQLLVGGIPPILVDTTVREVSFQTEHLGWQTDDFLVVCAHSDERLRKLVGQVKRNFTVSAKDEECKDTVTDFWRDFNDPERFSPHDDRLVLVTLRGTNTLLEHFSGLLDCARAAPDGEAFEQRLATRGFISARATEYCEALREIIGSVEGEPVTTRAVWPFLRALHVLTLDLNSSTRQAEAAIKGLLAYTARDGDGFAGAAASWDALVALASTAIPEAASLRRDDLPVQLQQRHGIVGGGEQHVLQALKEHSVPVLNRIKGTIGPFHIPRAGVVQQARAALDAAQVVIVSGPAGSGKSVIAKDLISALSKDHFVFAFRAEEFAEPHVDRTLQAAQVGVRAAALAAILGGQERTVILLESVERLLEKSTRDAFSDFIQLVASDTRFRVILTCRNYSLDLVCASFLQPEHVVYQNVPVPTLTDGELDEVAAAVPALTHPLARQALREILRNPYLLDRALQIEWLADRSAPESEREFRGLFWRQVVRLDQAAGAGAAQRREEVFEAIAVRRARALTDYVTCRDLDPDAVAALRRDSLIVSPDGRPSDVATAHDVLEDWAILHWLEEQHARGESSFGELSEAIGPHPAIRRSYRAWVAELVEREPSTSDRLFRAAIAPGEVSPQFRDDTLVSLLKAPMAKELLIRHEGELVADDCALLKRVIHLLRVACVSPLPWFADIKDHGSVFHVPEGAAWASVLGLVHRHLERFTAQDEPLLLALVEDAVRGVSWRAPDLEGAAFVAGIAYSLLPEDGYYGSDKWRKRVLSVLARIPNADPIRFETILRGPAQSDVEPYPEDEQLDVPAFLLLRRQRARRREPVTDALRSLLFSGMDGMPAARDLPDLIVSVAKEHLLAKEDDALDDGYWGGGFDLELDFGIRDGVDHDFFPASALRGLWLPLLRYHPGKGRDLIIDVDNHCGDWYASPRVERKLEPAWEIDLTFPDGTTRTQWANARLWQLHRGTSVGPYVLQSILMAFEKWLLEYAGAYPEQLDGILVDTLKRCESVMLTGVVASVATAHPHLAGEALLVLLSAPDCVRLDAARAAAERGNFSLGDVLGHVRPENAIYDGERKQSNKMPHRTGHLETAVANLQLGPLAPRIQAVLDRHVADLEVKDERDESDLAWRLAIQRMDLRRYILSPEDQPPSEEDQEEIAEERSPRRIRLEPEALEPDLQQFVDDGEAERTRIGGHLAVLNWGLQAFRRERDDYDPDRWQTMLERARDIPRQIEDALGARNGPAFAAAVAIRDHWHELSPDDRDWCVEVVCSEVERNSDAWDFETRIQRFEMSGDRPSARSLSLLVRRPLPDTQTSRVRNAWAVVMTHPANEVRWYGTWSIDAQFWAEEPGLALRCANAIATEASLVDEGLAVEAKRPWDKRRNSLVIGAEAALAVRRRFWEQGGLSDDGYRMLSIWRGAGAEALQKMLVIFGHSPAHQLSVEVMTRASTTLVAWWNSNRIRGKSLGEEQERNFEGEVAVANLLARFVLRMDPPSARIVLEPLLGETNSNPDELADFVRDLTWAEDREPNTEQYWYIWNLFAESIRQVRWLDGLDREHPWGSELLSAMFLTYGWKDHVTHWRSVEGHADNVHQLLESLPATAVVLDNYLRFLYHVGEKSMPDAFVRVARALNRGDAGAMLAVSNTTFLLEVLLQRHVYGRPLQLKQDPDLRRAVLQLLDALVEAGSSAAFRMRDDFVTPAL